MNKPLIFDFAIPREKENTYPIYDYDYKKNLNVVNIDGVEIPFVTSELKTLELETKTDMNREADDDSILLAEASTITKISRESDDLDAKMLQSYVEMETNTRAQREGNDSYAFLDLIANKNVKRV